MNKLSLSKAVWLSCVLLVPVGSEALAAERLKALIIDGQNNHAWQTTTPVLKWALEQSGRFTVEVATSPESGPKAPRLPKDPTPAQRASFEASKARFEEEKKQHDAAKEAKWKAWNPKFSGYDVVVSNYNGELWPEPVQQAFVEYVRNGGGFVAVHAADNAFPEWLEYNLMIGVGGWGGRSEKSGPMLRFRDGKIVRDETPGAGGTHGVQHEFVVEAREPEHPILKGLPTKWKHAGDELYAKLRGPAKNVTVLATAYSDPETKGTGEYEPMLMVTEYGKGRVFHTTLGHSAASMESLGFQVTLVRGSEWVATGRVTQPAVEVSELTADKAALRQPPAK
jgi:type 1 glutamine amidotransferase